VVGGAESQAGARVEVATALQDFPVAVLAS
jgi:hypothetical protein